MEQINFGGKSMKNIPYGSKKEYAKQMTHSVRKTLFAMRWAAFFYLGMNTKENEEEKETFGFPSQSKVPKIDELADFSNEVTDLIDKTKWRRNTSNPLQQEMRNIVRDNLTNNPNMIGKADKSSNWYNVTAEDYDRRFHDHITQDYKKGSLDDFNEVLRNDKAIAEDLEIDDRVFATMPREAYGTYKDTKENFHENPKMRVLNPCKPELGRVSKQFLEKIVHEVREKTGLLQWKNTLSCLQWFDKLQNKSECHFIQFDVVNFYGSISKQLLEDTMNWASTFTNIEQKTKDIIFHARKTFLFYQGEPYVKKNAPDFDCPMGAHDSAEVCELVGLYILSKLANLSDGITTAIYRDDGVVLSRLSRFETEIVKKKICKVFRDLGLSITISANKKIIDFLDVNLNLTTGEYKQFRKEGDKPVYVHSQSNHPPSILKNIPKNVNHRLNIISSNEKVFNEVKPMYQEALNASGYKHNLKFEKIDIHSLNNKNGGKIKRIETVNEESFGSTHRGIVVWPLTSGPNSSESWTGQFLVATLYTNYSIVTQ